MSRLLLAALPVLISGTVVAAAADEPSLPTGMSETRSGDATFNTADLVVTSVQGMLDEGCGGYCVVGACAHLNVGFSLRRGVYFYTIVSPKIRHPMPELLVSSYTHPGDEPYDAWRASFGAAISIATDSLGMAGGRPDPKALDQHQSGSFKEVDIIGHPLAALPRMINTDGELSSIPSSTFLRPTSFSPPDLSGGEDETVAFSDESSEGINVSEMVSTAVNGALGAGMSVIMDRYQDALMALRAVSVINDIEEAAEYFKSIAELMETINIAVEVTTRSTIYANLISPQFRMPRMLCPNSITPLQPYYMSFADAFWWRSGFPITDGPFSGSNHSGTILNPVSGDTLPVDADAYNPLAEVWGHKYPREGMVNQGHDAKTASVLAWRGMDVLQSSIPGRRIGIPVSAPPGGDEASVGDPRWQMIYPERKSCQPTPYYPSGALTDFMEPNIHGGYAWNYYQTYTCCSNTRGQFLFSVDFPEPLCITLGEVKDNADERAAEEAAAAEAEAGGG